MTSFPVKCHLPLITSRIEFKYNILAPPPQITPRRDLGAVIRRQARRATPYSRPKQEYPSTSTTTHRAESPLTDPSESECSDVDESPSLNSHKIAKPKGEAGRSNSGGYNLQVAMGWDDDDFNKFSKFVTDEAAKKLDIKFCYSKQKREEVEKVIQYIANRFEIQDRYSNDWPIRDALKLRLKYTSDFEKKKDSRKMESNLKQILKPKDK